MHNTRPEWFHGNHFLQSFHLLRDVLDQGDAILALRDSSKTPVVRQGQFADGVVPRSGGSSKRNKSRGERSQSEKVLGE